MATLAELIPPGAEALLPNALLIVAAIGAANATGTTCNPKTDHIGTLLGDRFLPRNAAWVRRHAARLHPRWAGLSRNGHCWLTEEGMQLAAIMRTAQPDGPPPAGCLWCGAARVGAAFSGRQLYKCGRVMQFCPDAVPGLPKPEIPPRQRKAQRDAATWFKVNLCGCAGCFGDKMEDGAQATAGLAVTLGPASNEWQREGAGLGLVLAAANGVALVQFPWDAADVVPVFHLVVAGQPDVTGMSEHQREVVKAIREGTKFIGGALVVAGRKVAPATLARLAERGIVVR